MNEVQISLQAQKNGTATKNILLKTNKTTNTR